MNTFRELEYQGWVDRASVYRDMFGGITSQAIEPILAALGNLSGRRFLDVACGTGELAAAAAARGARAEGIDFAATMVDKAARAHAGARFREGTPNGCHTRRRASISSPAPSGSSTWSIPSRRSRRREGSYHGGASTHSQRGVVLSKAGSSLSWS